MEIDPDFEPVPTLAGDEIFQNGIFKFNITKLREFIRSHSEQFEAVKVKVADFHKEFSRIDENHMDVVRIIEPVILAEISPGKYNLIDGNHRMEKARRAGIASISAYRLRAEQHVRFLTTKKAYKTYVTYWNSKQNANEDTA